MSGTPPVTVPEVQRAMQNPDQCLLQYVLVQTVGAGGMGTVWKAWDRKLARWVAVKFLNDPEPESLRRFEREARLAASLRHPNIASIYDVNEDRGRHFIVMEFVDGRSIEGSKRDVRRGAEIVRDAARAAHYAHQNGIVHRDLKPANLLERSDGSVCITDFGMAKAQKGDASLSVSGMIIGTPMYMPPEQATGVLHAVDALSDVYALGATLYTILSGRPPFQADNSLTVLLKVCTEEPIPPRKIEPAIPASLEAIVLKAMEKDKKRRYASAAHLADDLERFLDDRDVLARPVGITRRVLRTVRRNPWLYTSVLTLLLAAAAIGYVVSRPKPQSPPPDVRAEFRKIWLDSLEAGRFARAAALVHSNAFLTPDERERYLQETRRECATFVQRRTDEFLRNPTGGFAMPATEDLTEEPPLLAWCRAVRRTLENKDKEAVDPILEHAAAATLFLPAKEARPFTVAESLVFGRIRDRIERAVQEAKGAAFPRRKELLGQAADLRTKWSEFENRVAASAPAGRDRLRDLDRLIAGFPIDAAGMEELVAALDGSILQEKPEEALRDVEARLRSMGEEWDRLSLESRRDLAAYAVVVSSLLGFLDDRPVARIASDLRFWGERLKKLGGPGETLRKRYGPKVEEVFAELLR